MLGGSGQETTPLSDSSTAWEGGGGVGVGETRGHGVHWFGRRRVLVSTSCALARHACCL